MRRASVVAVVACIAAVSCGRRESSPPITRDDPRPLGDAEVVTPIRDSSVADEVRLTMTVLENGSSLMLAGAVPGLNRSGFFRQFAQWKIVAKLGERITRPLPDGSKLEFVVERGPYAYTFLPDGARQEEVLVRLAFAHFGPNCIAQSFLYTLPRGDEVTIAIDCDLRDVTPRGRPPPY